MGTPDDTRARFELLKPHLKGRFRRLWAAAEALSLGRGGRTQLASITGICVPTITRGIRELQAAESAHPAPARDAGARPVGFIDRHRIEWRDAGIVPALERMLDDEVAGDPMGEQRWVRCSLRKLRARLAGEGHHACLQTIAELLRRMGYSLRVNPRSGRRRATRIATSSSGTSRSRSTRS